MLRWAVALWAGLWLAAAVGAQNAGPVEPAKEERPAPRSIPELIDALAKDDFSGMAASRELAQRGPEAVPALIANLKHETPRARYWSIAALSAIGDERAIAPILASLDDPDATVRAVAVWHVSRWYDRAEVRRAVLAKLDDPSSFVQGYVLKVVQTRRDAQAIPQVREALESPVPEVRYDALHTLALVSGRGSLDAMRQALTEDESPLVRRCVLQCCTIIEPKRADCAELLILGLDDKDREVRETAVRLLRRGFAQYFGFEAEAEPAERQAAAGKWRRWYEQNASRLQWDEENRRFGIPVPQTGAAGSGGGNDS